MGSFSRSKHKGHYPNQNYGSGHYKRPHGSGGLLGKIFEALTGSKRHSQSGSNRSNGHYLSHRRRKSSWS